MLKLFKVEANGVFAIITEKDARDYGLVRRGNGCPFRAGVRVFTFVDESDLAQNPSNRHIYSGSKQFMDVALKTIAGDYQIVDNDPLVSGWDGMTPLFDSEKLVYPKEGGAPSWHRFCTTAEDMFNKFGQGSAKSA